MAEHYTIDNLMFLRIRRVLSNGRRCCIKVIFRMFLCDFECFWALLRIRGGAVAYCHEYERTPSITSWFFFFRRGTRYAVI